MDKRGVFETVFVIVAFIIVVGSVVGGTYILTKEGYNSNSLTGMVVKIRGGNNNYIGNMEKNVFYDYRCLEQIDKADRIYFKSFKEAEELNFKYIPKCPNES